MQFINKHMKGRQEVGNIDLLSKMSYIEVPEEDAEKVMDALDGTTYKGRDVRCNDADEGGKGRGRKRREPKDGGFERFEKKSKRRAREAEESPKKKKKAKAPKADSSINDDWRQFFKRDNAKLVGDEPDFSEEGWAVRKKKK